MGLLSKLRNEKSSLMKMFRLMEYLSTKKSTFIAGVFNAIVVVGVPGKIVKIVNEK